MGKLSKIEWTDHTWSPWWGCTKVSRGCKYCYAETLAKRTGFKIWGDDAPRRNLSSAHWNSPFAWDEEAVRKGAQTVVKGNYAALVAAGDNTAAVVADFTALFG